MNLLNNEPDPWADEFNKRTEENKENNKTTYTELPNTNDTTDSRMSFSTWNNNNVDELVSTNSDTHIGSVWGNNTIATITNNNNNNISPLTDAFEDNLSNNTKITALTFTNALDNPLSSPQIMHAKNRNGILGGPLVQNDYEEEELDTDDELWFQNARKTFNSLERDLVEIEELPEREGLLFKHTNYLIRPLIVLPNPVVTLPNDSSKKVVRRYSDFVWLQEVLLKKYPFRLIPELPPKMIGSQNKDPIFLERRRLGLSRFTNLIMKHPVLKNDDLVLTFLTVPTDLSTWRKQAIYDTTEEFSDKKIDKKFVKMWKNEYSEIWNSLRDNLDTSLEYWTKITILIERYEKRMKAAAMERYQLKHYLDKFTKECTSKLYPLDKDTTVADINTHFEMIEAHLDTCVDLTLKENKEVKKTLSEKFKTYIEILFALKGLFERYEMMAGSTVPQLQRRIELNAEKLESMRGKPDLRGAVYDKLEASIKQDRKSIQEQLNRSWLIKECILQEFAIFHETQFLVTNMFREWAALQGKYMDLNSNAWDKLQNNLENMPLSR
ncbi:related to Sorting nexin MVP1 [Saccharomycodes ludwigii]|uniref:Sorting nexin MVP1 n=1 Tax=Saccharomycodes ludwigii TaxID=36035 RepID=A0A376B7H4_9ASCO|nr:hypothetical protein SCDLUD_000925 [Saccharomycodes ludwigii]KAH3903300.1 hypothetical protein SCDLUD_000925 [Saccharomycodes ludwigii]SSD60571.1 related to Sorting nexin MVP1 [Saccharomycodes ludwigii]